MNRRVAFLFIFSGLGACYFIGYRESCLRRAASTTPEPLTIRQLIDRGPNGNPYVEVTDFRLLADPDQYAFEFDQSTQAWLGVYILAVPADGPVGPTPVIVRSTHIRSHDAVRDLSQRPVLRGLVMNSLDQVPDDVRGGLAERHPRGDLTACIVLEEGATPPGLGRVVLGWGAGIVFCAIGVATLFRIRWG